MEVNVFQRIQQSLAEKSYNLSTWLAGTSGTDKEIRLGPATEQGVRAHLEVVEAALEQAAGQNLGLCKVCHTTIDSELLQMDYTCCICLDHLSEPERRQLENELEFSQQVQRALLPQNIPDIAGLKLAVFSRPAQMLSGDYFDFFQFSDESAGLAIADAMGHGVSASMIMTSLQTALRTLAPESSLPAEVLGRVNRFYLHNSQFTTFVTVFLGRYDPDSHRLTYCNAGHNPPALYRRQEQQVEWLAPTGAAIGLIEDNPLRSGEVRLDEGDILLLYTDGVTEATNVQQEAFGAKRLADALREGAGLTSNEVVRSLRHRLHEFTGEALLSDDVTLVVGKREGDEG